MSNKKNQNKEYIFTVPDAKPFYQANAKPQAQAAVQEISKPQSYASAYKGPGSATDKPLDTKSAPKSLRELFKDPKRWIKRDSKRKADDGQYSFCLTGACREIYGFGEKYEQALVKLNKVIFAYQNKEVIPYPATPNTHTIVCFNDAYTTSVNDIQRVVNIAEV